jgi:hypothetical protein
MPLIVEDGTGLDEADAYVSVSYSNTFAESRGWTDWIAATDAACETAIREATAYIDTIARFKGLRLKASQMREFPRSDLADWSGYLVTGVPTRVKHATMELARKALSESLYVDLDRGGQVSAESVGPISVSYMPGAPVGKMFRAAMQLLEPFMRDRNQLYSMADSGAATVPEQPIFSIGMHDTGDPT